MYYVVDPSTNQKFGPADLATLNQWITENRILPTTVLEEAASGNRFNAAQVPGLNFPQPAAPAADPVFAQPTQPTQSSSGPSISQPPGGYNMGPVAPNANVYGGGGYGGSEIGAKKTQTSWICFVVGLLSSGIALCCPPLGLLSLGAHIFGVIEAKKAKDAGHGPAQGPFVANIIGIVIFVGLGILAAIGLSVINSAGGMEQFLQQNRER